jgi:hypothetical protein
MEKSDLGRPTYWRVSATHAREPRPLLCPGGLVSLQFRGKIGGCISKFQPSSPFSSSFESFTSRASSSRGVHFVAATLRERHRPLPVVPFAGDEHPAGTRAPSSSLPFLLCEIERRNRSASILCTHVHSRLRRNLGFRGQDAEALDT